MWDDIRKTLGNYTNDFNLDEWFYDLDAKAARLNLVIPKRDQGAWLQAQLVEEAARRGLNIAGAVRGSAREFPHRLALSDVWRATRRHPRTGSETCLYRSLSLINLEVK
jgi:hypothetical protein